MFEGLIDRFSILRRKILGYGRISKGELESILKDIRVTLLEADVNYLVAKEFVNRLRSKCEKRELSKSLKPGDIVIKDVYEELVMLLGQKPRKFAFAGHDTLVVSLLGLQGAGKTTTAVKLAVVYKSRNPLLVPADAKRPAAYEQLQQLAARAGISTQPLHNKDVISTVKRALERAVTEKHGILIIDTAGRLHIDDELVQELVDIHRTVKPDYRLLVADGMSGQDAVNQAKNFNEKVGLDGAILTKMDGDARGGAALSITRAAEVPLFYVGTGEALDGIEEFHPDRMAQRIMGMGDLTSLVEKVKLVETEIDQKKLQKKVIKGDLNFDDFLEQMRAVKKLGPIAKLAAMIPGIKESDIDEDEMKKVEAMINSMTKEERNRPEIIDGSRKRRIAAGSGTTVQNVNRLLKQFNLARNMLKKFGKSGFSGKIPFPMKQ
jgi:signal recognition particle subunit SRP54